MRENYELTAFYLALDAWEKHKADWLKKIKDSRQPAPPTEAMVNYRNLWLEGWLECYAENQAKEDGSNRVEE